MLFGRLATEHAERGGGCVCITATEKQSETVQEMEKTAGLYVQGEREDVQDGRLGLRGINLHNPKTHPQKQIDWQTSDGSAGLYLHYYEGHVVALRARVCEGCDLVQDGCDDLVRRALAAGN